MRFSVLSGLLVVGSLVVSSVVHSSPPEAVGVTDEPTYVSLIQLIATPQEYDKKVVRVVGFCRLEFDVEALYLHREDLEAGLTRNSVALVLGSDEPEDRRHFTDVYVIVEGLFNTPTRRSIFGGKLVNITRFERYPSRDEMSPLR